MGKLRDWFKKKFRGSSSSGTSSPAPARDTQDVEKQIDIVVREFFISDRGIKLLWLNSSINFWQSVVKAICFAESSFNPRERFFETSMGYFSEGLMQLSYEDCKAYHFPLDKSKNEIFSIEKNVTLGLIILDKLVQNHGKFIFNSGNYWAVLQPKNKRHQVFLDKFNQYQKGV
jgi:hypothetical protein